MQHFFASKIENEYVYFFEQDCFQILNVLRFKHKQQVIVVYKGVHYLIMLNIKGKRVFGTVVEQLKIQNENLKKTCIVISVLKHKAMNFLIQKASELGVNDIIPISTVYSIPKFNSEKEQKKRINHWKLIAKEASEQAHRNYIPRIHSFKKLDNLEAKDDLNLIADEKYKKNNDTNYSQWKSITCVFGPEGGFHPDELKTFNRNGFQSISLGKRVFRAETAVIVFLSNFV